MFYDLSHVIFMPEQWASAMQIYALLLNLDSSNIDFFDKMQ